MALGSLAPYDLTTPNLIEGLIYNNTNRTITKPAMLSRATRVVTITPDVTAQEITVYRLRETLTGQVVTFTSDATPTAAEVVTGLTTAFRANPILNGQFVASGTTTLVLTARQAGIDYSGFTFVDGGSTPTNTLAVAETNVANDGSDLLFGRAISVSNTGVFNRVSAALSATNEFAGVVGFTYADIENVVGRSVGGYPTEAAYNLVTDGIVAVWSDTAVNPTADVFVIHANGRFRATADSTNTSQVNGTGVIANWVERTTAAGLTWLRFNSGK